MNFYIEKDTDDCWVVRDLHGAIVCFLRARDSVEPHFARKDLADVALFFNRCAHAYDVVET